MEAPTAFVAAAAVTVARPRPPASLRARQRLAVESVGEQGGGKGVECGLRLGEGTRRIHHRRHVLAQPLVGFHAAPELGPSAGAVSEPQQGMTAAELRGGPLVVAARVLEHRKRLGQQAGGGSGVTLDHGCAFDPIERAHLVFSDGRARRIPRYRACRGDVGQRVVGVPQADVVERDGLQACHDQRRVAARALDGERLALQRAGGFERPRAQQQVAGHPDRGAARVGVA